MEKQERKRTRKAEKDVENGNDLYQISTFVQISGL